MCDQCPPFCTDCGEYGCSHAIERWQERLHASLDRSDKLETALHHAEKRDHEFKPFQCADCKAIDILLKEDELDRGAKK